MIEKLEAMIEAIVSLCKKTLEIAERYEGVEQLRQENEALKAKVTRLEETFSTKEQAKDDDDETERNLVSKIMDEWLNGKENENE